MTLPVHFLKQAAMDVEHAYAWYESESTGLGAMFRDDIQKALQRITEFPFSGAKVSGTLHRILIYRFQYAIIYEPSQYEIIVVRVVHCASMDHSHFLD